MPATVCDWLLEALGSEGVTHLFGNPGSTELPLMDALTRQDAVQYVLGLHEGAVMGMADGWAQTSGQLAAVNLHVAAGLANGMAGILNASRARVPMLVTVGQQHTALAHADAFLGGDLVGIARPLAKDAWEIPTRDAVADMVAEAVHVARTPPCGPVVVSLPLDVQAADAPGMPHRPAEVGAPTAVDAATIDRIIAMIAGARSPVFIAGDGVDHDRAGGTLRDLATRWGIPVWGEPQAARAPVDWDASCWRGLLPSFGRDIRELLAPHDLVVAFGCPVFRLFGYSDDGPLFVAGTRLIHVDVDAANLGRLYPPEVGLVAHPGGVIAALAARPGPVTTEDPASRSAVNREHLSGAVITPEVLSRAITTAIDADVMIVEEGLTSTRPLRRVMRDRRSGNWLAHRGSALGWGLPAAVGASLAAPHREVWSLQGDGSLVFGVSALWSAVHYGARMALIVADNRGYEILKAGVHGVLGDRDASVPGLDIPGLDLEQLCASFGATTARVDDPACLAASLDDLRQRAQKGPSVLVVGVDGETAPVGYPV